MQAVVVREASQVGEARRCAMARARDLGLGETGSARAGIVATELATNLIKHGAGGEILVGAYEDETGSGLECLALDKGPGMRDIGACLADGFSTAGSPGTGLGAVSRQSHTLEIFSQPGLGSVVLARLSLSEARTNRTVPAVGSINVPYPGEIASGDAWCAKRRADGFIVMVADGLGHGPQAAEASHAAIQAFSADFDPGPVDLLHRMHGALRSTRGAAVGIALYHRSRGMLVFAGVGNVAASLVSPGAARRLVSHNGTIGHTAKRIQSFEYLAVAPFLIVLASDGLGTNWNLDAYPGLQTRHPTLIAGVLYRDFSRGRDDVTVLVVREDVL